MEWLAGQLRQKLILADLDDGVRCDIQTLLAVLQCPVFEKIVTIEVRAAAPVALLCLSVASPSVTCAVASASATRTS